MLTKIAISRVELAAKFATTSSKFGFDREVVNSYEEDILDLQELWERQGYIDVFDPEAHNYIAYGMIKSSLSDPGAWPAYDGFYHARVLPGENDPLVIVKFKGEIVPQTAYEKAVILTMIDHDLMFMPKGRKSAHLKKQQREWVSYIVDNENKN